MISDACDNATNGRAELIVAPEAYDLSTAFVRASSTRPQHMPSVRLPYTLKRPPEVRARRESDKDPKASIADDVEDGVYRSRSPSRKLVSAVEGAELLLG
jgi:hypothetical protein